MHSRCAEEGGEGGRGLHRNEPLEGDIGLIIIIYDLSEAAPRLALVARPTTSSLIDGTGTLCFYWHNDVLTKLTGCRRVS